MTQQTPDTPTPPKPGEAATGDARPNPTSTEKPAQNPPAPATGGQGAAGAGGPDGFGGGD